MTARRSFLTIQVIFLPLLYIGLTGCEALKESPNYEFGQGY